MNKEKQCQLKARAKQLANEKANNKQTAGAGGTVQVTKKPKKHRKPRPPKAMPARLPNGSVIHAVYRAQDTVWAGCLIAEGVTFLSEAKSLFSLFSKLDRHYRKSLLPAAAELGTLPEEEKRPPERLEADAQGWVNGEVAP